jgi:hypothetical protein
MEYDEMMGTRLSVLEARVSAIEQQLFVLLQGGMTIPKRRKRDLTTEERAAIRARLVAGQEKARAEREVKAKTQAKATTNGKKEPAHEG